MCINNYFCSIQGCSRDPRRKNLSNEVFNSYQISEINRPFERNKEPLPVKVSYEASEEAKCKARENRYIKENSLRPKEVAVVKEAEAKWHSSVLEKNKNQVCSTCSRPDNFAKIEDSTQERSCSPPSEKGMALCAECEKCEIQIKVTGDGVVLKCQGCRQVPGNSFSFPGNSKKIIKLP